MRRVQLSQREEQARQVLNLLRNVLGLSDEALARAMGVKYQAIQQRRKGSTRIRLEDRARLADALGVPEFLFDMEVPDVLRWLADNGRDLLITASPCTTAPNSFRVPCAA